MSAPTRLMMLATAGLLFAGAVPAVAKSKMATKTASAALIGPDGSARGSATISQTPHGLQLVVDAVGVPAGVHGLHIHAVGKCDGPEFTTAGSHWNPTAAKHGKDAQGGPHWGDVPNITTGADGKGRIVADIHGAKLMGGKHPLLDADGAAVVIHATADDYKTDPSGNSGGRIACGVFKPR